MDQLYISPRPRTLNLLESLMMEDQNAEQNDRECRSPGDLLSYSPEYYDKDRHTIARESMTSSFSEFKMNDIVLRTKVAAADPNAGFRGKKIRKDRPGSAAWKEGAIKIKSQRPFSADYSRNKRRQLSSNPNQRRAKSAKGPRQPQMSAPLSRRSRSRSVDISSGTGSSDEEYLVLDEQSSEHGDSANADNEHTQNRRNHSAKVVQLQFNSDSSGQEQENSEQQPKRERQQNRRRTEPDQSPRLLDRRKEDKSKLKLFKTNPEKYYEEKLSEKYTELDIITAGNIGDPRRQVIQNHLQQMDRLHEQYQSSSHGHLMTGPIIPQSLPREVREVRRNKKERPLSAPGKPSQRRASIGSNKSKSKPAEKPERKTSSNQQDRKLDDKSEVNQNEETESETPDIVNTTHEISSNTDGVSDTPNRITTTTIDHHIKYSENDYLQKWLKTKDKQHRRNVKEEKKKKRAEREKIINEANDKLQKRILSQQHYAEWMRAKNKKLLEKQKERSQYMGPKHVQPAEMSFPGSSVHIKSLNRSVEEAKEPEECLTKTSTENNHSSDWQPPQTKFMYKRPISGRIKLYYQSKDRSDTGSPDRKVMHVRGKSPVASRAGIPDNDRDHYETSDKRPSTSAGWRSKNSDGETRTRSEKQRSDADRANRSSVMSRGKLSERSNSAVATNGGLWADKSWNESSSIGANLHSGNTAYDDGEGMFTRDLTTRHGMRPSTAPTRRKTPAPKKGNHSPRQIAIVQRNEEVSNIQRNDEVSNVQRNEAVLNVQRNEEVSFRRDNTGSSDLPFQPEKGVPAYVAQKQNKLFGEAVYSKSEQRQLLQEVLVKEGVADINDNDEEQTDKLNTENNSLTDRDCGATTGPGEKVSPNLVHEEIEAHNGIESDTDTDVLERIQDFRTNV